ncbi:MAG: CHASE2 domain-containing protein, partial [Deltaproteobacteria bacterium]|nr:CHASE2 domain-containing protein [Deltaproteobacteria bacterium]
MGRAQFLTGLLAAVVVCGAVLGMRELAWLQPLELVVYDQYQRLASPEPASPSQVVVVEIGERDIREQGHWPLSSTVLAAALRVIAEAGPRAIGLDIYRDLPVEPGEAQLARIFAEEPRIIAVRKFGDFEGDAILGPPALEGSDPVGFNDVVPDPDTTVRRGLLFQNADDSEVDFAFALRVALLALGIQPAPDPERPEWLRLGQTTLPPLESTDGGYVDLDAAGYQFLLDFGAGRAG